MAESRWRPGASRTDPPLEALVAARPPCRRLCAGHFVTAAIERAASPPCGHLPPRSGRGPGVAASGSRRSDRGRVRAGSRPSRRSQGLGWAAAGRIVISPCPEERDVAARALVSSTAPAEQPGRCRARSSPSTALSRSGRPSRPRGAADRLSSGRPPRRPGRSRCGIEHDAVEGTVIWSTETGSDGAQSASRRISRR
jgi:hypothetical protein